METNNSNSIEKHLITKIPVISENSSIKDVIELLEKRNTNYDSIIYIYTIDKKENLSGVLSIKEIFNNSKNTPIKKLFKKNVIDISLNMGLEQIAHLALIHKLKQIPVTKDKKIIGIVSSKEILSTINKSLKQDIFNFAGIHKSHLDFENNMEIPILKALKNRISWLIIGFIGAMIIALYIGLFEETLSKYLVIASFVPTIVYLSDSLGTQSQTLFIRDLAIFGKNLNIKKYFIKQTTIAFLIALIFACLIYLFILLIWKIPHIAFIISLSCFCTLLIANFFSFLITYIIKKSKFDPALGSGPIATIISDITSIVVYFIIVVLLI